MSQATAASLDPRRNSPPAADEFIRAAMEWHFSPETGAPFWLERAAALDFDPRGDVRCHDDLARFPNLANEMRDVPVRDLIPRGYGENPDLIGVFESGGTTGAPKRVVCPRDWMDGLVAWSNAQLDAQGFPRGVDWLGLVPSGPHIVSALFHESAVTHGRRGFHVDMDPRWVKKLIAAGRTGEAAEYAGHVLDQAADVLLSQDIGVIAITPPLLERLAERRDLVELVNAKVRAIRWGGTHLDADTYQLYRTEIFPGIAFCGQYGSTMMLGIAGQRPMTEGDDLCVFDPFSPYVSFAVVDPETRRPVARGERGQVVISHVSKAMLLPNNLERDMATRVAGLPGQVGDSVADVAPVRVFDNDVVIEGVY